MHEDEKSAVKKKSRAHGLLAALSLLIVLLLPFAAVAVISFALPPVFDNTFLGELSDKYELLNSTDTQKLVVVGGSSVAFGLDSEMAEEELGMKVVNFGLYANLGTKIMMDLSRSNINEGDIIVLAPELNDQTLSMYFNAETAMQTLDGNWGLTDGIGDDNYTDLLGELWSFAAKKLGYLISGSAPESDEAYQPRWFNANGDNDYDRPFNVMTEVEQTITLDYRVDTADGITSEYEEFVDYVNEYVEYCRARGATVYFSFAPMNAAALTDYNTDEHIYEFYENLCSSLNCRVISNINDYIMDEGYFFDSEFHLNNDGVVVRTVRLIDDIKRELGNTDITMSADALPEPPGYAPVIFEEGDEENLYLELELGQNAAGQTVWYIVGLNDVGRSRVSITIPKATDGYPIAGIRENAFSGSQLRTLVIGENITHIASGAFGGAAHLSEVYVRSEAPSKITVPNNSNANGLMTKGASSSLRIYVPSAALPSYMGHYFWGDYSHILLGY